MAMQLAFRLRFAHALRSRPFALLWSGQTISALGDGAYLTALAWQVLLLTHSGAAMGAVLIATSVPRLLFLVVGGVAADRFPRRLVLLAADAGRAVAVLAVALLARLALLQLWHLVALSLLFGCAEGFFRPAYQALPPELVDVEALPSANALGGLSQQFGRFLGPLLGAAMVAVAGPTSAFAFDGLTFLVSAWCLLLMRTPADRRRRESRQPAGVRAARVGGVAGGIALDLRDGLGYVLGTPWLWSIIAVASLRNIGWAGMAVALPKQVYDAYGGGIGLYGIITAASALGTIAATIAMAQLRRLRRRGLVAHLAMCGACLALAAYGARMSPGVAAVLVPLAAVVFGVGTGVFGMIWVTVLQELVPADKLGRVSSIDFLGSFVLAPVGYAIAGMLTDGIGPGWVLVASGAMNLALTAISLGVREVRRLE